MDLIELVNFGLIIGGPAAVVGGVCAIAPRLVSRDAPAARHRATAELECRAAERQFVAPGVMRDTWSRRPRAGAR